MAEIRITIPDDKISSVVEAVQYYIDREASEEEAEPITVTPIIASKWIKQKLINELKRLVKNHQEQKYREAFLFDNPLE